jgi:cell division protein ZapA
LPEVNVEIAGRKYRMACEEGQEQHLYALAESFNARIEGLKGSFGEIGDSRLTVMAGIAALDELLEAQAQVEKLKQDVSSLTRAGQAMAAETEQMEVRFTRQMSEAARRIESIATAIDDTGAGNAA